MNLTDICPNIPDDWKGGVAATARILGGDKPLSRTTIMKYASLGKHGGGLDRVMSKSGRVLFLGKEIKRFWREF